MRLEFIDTLAVTLQQLPMADLRLREEETLLASISVSFRFPLHPAASRPVHHCHTQSGTGLVFYPTIIYIFFM